MNCTASCSPGLFHRLSQFFSPKKKAKETLFAKIPSEVLGIIGRLVQPKDVSAYLSICTAVRNVNQVIVPTLQDKNALLNRYFVLLVEGQKPALPAKAFMHIYDLDLSSVAIHDPDIPKIAEMCPKLKRLNISRSHSLSNESLLRTIPKIEHLESLAISSKHVTKEAVFHLSTLPNLSHLDVAQCTKIEDFSFERFPKLTSLGLSGIGLKDNMLHALRSCKLLHSLDLSKNSDITAQGIRALVQAKQFVLLNLSCTSVDNNVLRALQANSDLLVHLHLSYGYAISNSSLKFIRSMQHVRTLSLEGCVEISNFGIKQLQNHPALETLFLTHCYQLTDACYEHLSSLPKLRALYLDSTHCTGLGCTHLVANKSLRLLDLSSCPISDDGVHGIATLKQLRTVLLKTSGIVDTALLELTKIDHLRIVNLFGSHNISKHAAEQFQKKRPDVRLIV
jgi:hypothetical protein